MKIVMKTRFFRFLTCALGLLAFTLPLFSQPVLVDASSKVEYTTPKDLAIKIMQEEMATVIPKGKKTVLENFAGTSGTQVINAYQIAKHEVTQELYMAVMGANPSYFKNNPESGEVQEKRPVENVSWYDAVYFCNKLSMIMELTPAYSVNGQTDPEKWNYKPHTGDYISSKVICDYSASGFRLPTEAEWEMAARGGVAGGWDYKYAGSDRIDDVAWYSRNSNDKTHEVGKKKPNALGLYDMSGNVWEWVWEAELDSSRKRYNRGGCFYFGSGDCVVDNYYVRNAVYQYCHVGFRLLRPLN